MPSLEKLTLKHLFDNSVEEYSELVALSFVDEEPLTYKDLQEKVKSLSDTLKLMGISNGDKIAIVSENSPFWGITYFAITTIGAIVVPVLPDFHKAEVHHIIRNSGAKIVFLSQKQTHKIDEPNLGDLQLVVSLDDAEISNSHYETTNMSDLLAGDLPKKLFKEKKRPGDGEIKEDDLAEILYTSGTTGHSKGVMLTHKNIVSNALNTLEVIHINAGEVFISVLPMAHSFECTAGFIGPISTGASIFYIKGLPTAQTLLPALAKIKPHYMLSVPLIMEKIYKKKVLGEINAKAITRGLYKVAPMRKLLNKVAGKKLYQAFGGNLKFICFGGAATQPDVERFLIESKFPYTSGYGLTESSPVITVNPLDKVVFQSCGKAIPGVEVKIEDPDAETNIGEILARGPNIMQGYYKNPEATKATLTEDGWLRTGDRGYLDDEGYLFIKGRSKNIIVGPSGENIFPEEIEFRIAQNPYVLESLVYELDRKIIARIHLDYDALDAEFAKEGLDEAQAKKRIQELLESIRVETNSKISSYSRIHRVIEQPEEFEKTPTKKIKRYLYITEQEF